MRGVFQDITGHTVGWLTALKYVGGSRWLCRCKCGTEKIILRQNFAFGNTISCGCYRRTMIKTVSKRRAGLRVDYGSLKHHVLHCLSVGLTGPEILGVLGYMIKSKDQVWKAREYLHKWGYIQRGKEYRNPVLTQKGEDMLRRLGVPRRF